MPSPELLVLRRQDIIALLTLADCVGAVENAFRFHAEGKTLPPTFLHVESHPGEFHIKGGGLVLDRTYFALKTNGSFFQNRERYGLPNIQGAILLFDGNTGSPLALMDSMEITLLRTAAVVVIAAKYMARPNSTVVTLCGCGNQGRMQLRGLVQFLLIKRVLAFDADAKIANRYAAEMGNELGIEITPVVNLENAIQQSDVVVTCTPSRQYFLLKHFVKPGTFIAATGADTPDKRELEPTLLVGNRVIVDLVNQCATLGELHHALDAGLLTLQDVAGELGDVITGKTLGRTSPNEITIFDSTGTALQDAAAAILVYQRAMERGVGLPVALSS